MHGSRFAFGPFVLDLGAGTLLRNDVPVAVSHRGLKLLAALVEHPGEILTKAELMDAAWPGIAVEQGNLTVQIAQIRKLIGSADDGDEWIATVPRVGYRFTGAIEPLSDARKKRYALPDKPSIAVLPFASLGDEQGQEAFADGLTEDLITTCRARAACSSSLAIPPLPTKQRRWTCATSRAILAFAMSWRGA